MQNEVSTELFEIGADGLKPVTTEGKNDLERGRILQLAGYEYPRYVIIKNLGINEHFPGYGARYTTVNLSDKSQSRHDAHTLKFIADKDSGRIQMYILDEILPEAEIAEIWEKSEVLRRQNEEDTTNAELERQVLISKGKELFERYIPDDSKALIVAQCDINDCDMQTDYFNVKTGDTVIIGWSKHTRDDFREFRKYADNIPETAHLKIPPIVDENGDERTENNKSWWTPSDEHREKYSMGRGYYLKDGRCYSSGWMIKKVQPWSEGYNEGVYISLAKRCIFE